MLLLDIGFTSVYQLGRAGRTLGGVMDNQSVISVSGDKVG